MVVRCGGTRCCLATSRPMRDGRTSVGMRRSGFVMSDPEGPEVLTPVQARMALPLGQTGRACYVHTPRAVVQLDRAPATSPLVLLGPCPVSAGDRPPATVGALAARTGGSAVYVAALLPDGPQTAPGVTPEGTKTRVPLPALDRWVLREVILVRWSGERGRGFAGWLRSGRGRWTPTRAWWRQPDGWRFGRISEVP